MSLLFPMHTPTCHIPIVTINGTNLFGHGGNITSVFFGNVSATIDYLTANNSIFQVRVQENSNSVNITVQIQIIADTGAIVQSAIPIWTYLVQGRITSNQPREGQVGTRIEINGVNLLGGGETINEIFLDGVSGSILNSSSTRIVIIMNDLGLQQQNFSPSQIFIQSNTGAVVLGGTYTHRSSGMIDRFSPTRGRKGTIVTIVGTNLLGFGTNLTRVEVAGVTGNIVSFNNNVIVIRAGMGLLNQTGPVQLMVDTGAVITSTTNFTFDEPGIVNEVTPTAGAEGTGVRVSGSGLIPSNVQLTNITVGGILVSRVVTASNREVSIIVGPAPPTNASNAMIVITASDGSFIDGIFFSFISLTISLPRLSRGQEGTIIEVNLPNDPQFEPSFNLRATVDDQISDILSVNTTLRNIMVRVPRARRLGTFLADVAVEGANGIIARLRDGFTYLAEGVIYNIAPITGQMGTNIILQGENLLGGGTEIISAMVVGQPARVVQFNNEMVMLSLNRTANSISYPQQGDIILTANTGAIVQRLDVFTLVAPGNIMQVTPQVGQNRTRVTITGTNLIQGNLTINSITLAGTRAMILSVPTDTSVIVYAAPSSATQPLPVIITLSSGATIQSSTTTFQYLSRGQITTIEPNSGTVGTRVIISGSNLLQGGLTVRQVLLGNVSAQVNSASDTLINVTAQTGIRGNGDVVIISSTYSTLVGPGLWNYENLGSISSVTPHEGQQGVNVTIIGNSLLGTSATGFSACILAGIQAEVVLESGFSNTRVVCRAGVNPNSRRSISGQVQLITNTGVTLRSSQNTTIFTYYTTFINSISPTQGNNGTEVIISGTNLFSSPNATFQVSRVLFGAVQASVTNSSMNEIHVRVSISNITVNDTVRVESTSGSFLELENAWNYTRPGQIITMSPQFGLPGENITLYGDRLVPDGITRPKVILGQTEAYDIRVINTSTILFRAGIYQNSDNPNEDLPVQVVSPTGETIFNASVIFRYNATVATVSSINPVAGSQGSIVNISGTNLPNISSISRILLANTSATVLSAQANQIRVMAGEPLSPLGSIGEVRIETGSGLFGLAGDAWRYFPKITVNEVSPRTGQNGTTVAINLTSIRSLPSIDAVYLVNVSARVIGLNNGILMVQAGYSTATSLGDIRLFLSGNIVVKIPNAWSYQPPVDIIRVTPLSGYFNTLVTIEGNQFHASSVRITAVYLAGMETIIQSQNNTHLQVRISERSSTGIDMIGPVTILANTGAFHSSERVMNFTYVGIRVNNISPQSGTRGTRVTLMGIGLLAGGTNITSATIAGILASVQSMNSTVVSFIAGASTSSSNASNITYFVNTGAIVQIQNIWSYIEPGEITSVTPSTGTMGTIVSIVGNGLFGGGSRVVAVFLNSQMTTDIRDNFANFVQVVAPSGTGSGNIRIISDTQAITESNNSVQFTYLSPATFDSINPMTGQNGTIVNITGRRIHDGEGVGRVFLAGVEATIISVQDANDMTTITVEARRPTEPGPFGGPVVVRSSLNATSISTQNFTYITEGVIFSVTPNQGRNGTVVSIEGENMFGGGTMLQSVILNGLEADIINESSSNIFVRAPLGLNTGRDSTGNVILVSNTNAHVLRVDGWTYSQQGVINNISPTDGQYGTTVRISGQNLFSDGDGIAALKFGDVFHSIISASSTTIMARIGQPVNRVAFTTDSITLTSNLGGVLYQDFSWNYLNQSSITAVSPPNGISQTLVVITGTNLLGGGTAINLSTVAGIEARVISYNNTQVVIETGMNEDGEMRMGLLILESDTGALTEDMWIYNEECANNTFGVVGSCQNCSIQCMGCVGPSEFNCTSCMNFGILGENSSLQCVTKCPNVSTLDNICVDTCELNQYAQIDTQQNETFCYNCSNLCDPTLGCSGPGPSQCHGCRFFRDIVNQTCVKDCPRDTFYINETKECRPCNSQCLGGCSGPSNTECFGCANLRISTNAIMNNSFNDICREVCPSLFLRNGSNCIPCDSSCSVGCSGPTPFNCESCKGAFFAYPNGTRKCVPSCNYNSVVQLYYQDINNECKPCSNLCLPSGGCMGPQPSDCSSCSLYQDSTCVSNCKDNSYFINETRSCQKCDSSCGDGGCTGAGPENCLKRGAFVAGPGTVALVVIFIIILVAIIVVLVLGIIWRVKGGKYKFNKYTLSFFSRNRSLENGLNDPTSNARYTSRSPVQIIPLSSVERKTANPIFVNEGTELYTEMGPEGVSNPLEEATTDVLYNDAETEQLALPEKNKLISASQDLYTEMDALSPTPQVQEVSASQDLYTDMEPILPEKQPISVPTLPPKPGSKVDSEDPKPTPPLPAKDGDPPILPEDKKPPIPSRSEKNPPPSPPPQIKDSEVYTDMEDGIKEVFINPGTQDDVYDDVELQSPNPITDIDSTYEDTEGAINSMQQYKISSAGTQSTSSLAQAQPAHRSITKGISAPALPSQPIPKKRLSVPLPQTPLQKSLSSSSTVSSPTSTTPSVFSRPESVISDIPIPEEESLYDDIPGIQPLVESNKTPTKSSKQQKKVAKPKKKK